MKIGVWLGSNNNPQEGGGTTYLERLISGLDTYQFNPKIEVCFISEGICTRPFKKQVLELQFLPQTPFIFRLLSLIPINSIRCRVKDRLVEKNREMKWLTYTNQLRQNNVKIIYYLQQLQCWIPDFPFISTNWDIGHLSTFSFPEVTYMNAFGGRFDFYTKYLTRALLVFAESESGKEELIRYTWINPSKVKVVPIFAGECVNHIMPNEKQVSFLNSINLEKNKYFFYPAQFWAHKNHVGLIKAFAIFQKDYPDYKLVLTGSDKGTLSHVQETISQLNLQHSILYLGFVSIEEMNTLYKNATSLVMASFMGPTNMPLLEAMELDCPVICSDLKGHREELEDAGIYFNPENSEDMASAMDKIVRERDVYLNRIKERAKITEFRIDVALDRINNYLLEASQIRDNWG